MFTVPTKTQYGIRALVHLARMDAVSAASSEIARAEGIPSKYLEGILVQLKTSGLVHSERGKNGGYRLAKPASEIRMIEIVEAMEGEVKPVGCLDDAGTCSQGECCLPRVFWVGLKEAIDGYLGSRTLFDVIQHAN
jgi:Rrf2 family transcriptional regulator, iron-sulfur cluster assembly transcription factor